MDKKLIGYKIGDNYCTLENKSCEHLLNQATIDGNLSELTIKEIYEGDDGEFYIKLLSKAAIDSDKLNNRVDRIHGDLLDLEGKHEYLCLLVEDMRDKILNSGMYRTDRIDQYKMLRTEIDNSNKNIRENELEIDDLKSELSNLRALKYIMFFTIISIALLSSILIIQS